MKKSIIAMAVAGALAVPAIASADATLYGSLRAVMDKTDNAKADLRNGTQGSRLGVRGNVDLGLGETVGIYQVEFRFSPVDSGTGEATSAAGFTNNNVTRGGQSYLGAKGAWGTALVGSLDHPTYSLVSSRTEISKVGNSVDTLLQNYPETGVTSTLAYVSPNLSGFQAIAGMVVAGGDSESKNIDGYQLGASFNGVENLNVGIAYGRVSRDANLFGAANAPVDNLNKWGLAADYTFADLKVAASYERIKDKDSSDTTKAYGLSGTYNITSGLSAAVRYTTEKTTDSDRRKATQLELANTMGNGTIAAGYVDRNRAFNNGDDTFYVGYRLNF